MHARAALDLARHAALASVAGSALADPVADFYKGRTMTVVISGSTGSTYDVGTRLIVKHMSRHIPGQPQIVPKSMIGAGHLIATNYLYNVAERDGSVIGSIGETVPMAHLLTPAQAKFKAGRILLARQSGGHHHHHHHLAHDRHPHACRTR